MINIIVNLNNWKQSILDFFAVLVENNRKQYRSDKTVKTSAQITYINLSENINEATIVV